MADKKTVLTQEGLKEREDELRNLKMVRRKEVAEKIKEARGQGDLSENAEYDAAKEEQAEIEARIVVLEKMLRNVEIIDGDNLDRSQIMVGSTVTLIDLEYNEEMRYTIVGSLEANPQMQKISNESPLGSAIIGHREGDTVNVETPSGVIQYKIVTIE